MGEVTTKGWICPMLDAASLQLLALEERGRYAQEMRVGSELYEAVTSLRSRELEQGAALLVLGTILVEDPALADHEFAIDL